MITSDDHDHASSVSTTDVAEPLCIIRTKISMGKGDKKSNKGKRSRGSYGKTRLKNREKRNLIKIQDLKKWSLERLFIEIGQYDFTVSIVFKENSESHKKFGRNITGILYYTKKERKLLKAKVNSGIKVETKGKVLFTTLLKDQLRNDQIKELSTKGFNNKDILFLDYYGHKHNPTYFNKKSKKLSEPIKIEINNDFSYEESYKMMFNFYRKRVDDGDMLSDFEKIEMMAIKKALSINETDPKFVFASNVEVRKQDYDFLLDEINYYLEKTDEINPEVFQAKIDSVKQIVDMEFIKAGIKPKKALEIAPHLGLYNGFLQIGLTYRDEIVIYGTNPKIILDFEGFMHVVFRHCNVCNIGKNNIAKSRIPYKLTDIKPLIKSCLEPLKEEIKSNFSEHPGKRYSKFGDQMIRFNGDYYEVQINEKGRIETFFNHEDKK